MDLQGWPAVVLTAVIAVAAAWIALFILRRLYARQWFSHSAPGMVLRRADPALKLALPAVGLTAVIGFAPALPYVETAQHLVTVLLILSFTWLVSLALCGLGEWIIVRHPATVADNLTARHLQTQVRVIVRSTNVLIVLIGVAIALMSFPAARKFGVSLLASAGIVGIGAGMAAKSVLSNLLAGLQIAFAQPIRIDDVLIVKNEWGRVEEITATYVVLCIWDQRRLIIPLNWFMDNPFQNWTRTSAQIIGSVFLWVDFRTQLEPVRAELARLVQAAPEWDRNVAILQVTDTSDRAMQLRVIVSAADSGRSWDLQCKVREGLIRFLRRHDPGALPRLRMENPSTTEPQYESQRCGPAHPAPSQ